MPKRKGIEVVSNLSVFCDNVTEGTPVIYEHSVNGPANGTYPQVKLRFHPEEGIYFEVLLSRSNPTISELIELENWEKDSLLKHLTQRINNVLRKHFKRLTPQ